MNTTDVKTNRPADMPLRSGEAMAIQFLCGLVSEMERGKSELEKRIRFIGKERQFKKLSTEIGNLLEAILDTVPLEKLRVLKRNLDSQEMKIHTKSSFKTPDDPYTYVPTDALYDLHAFASRWECKVCDGDGECMRNCRYRKVLKRVIMVDVDESDGECMGKKINFDE